MKYFSVAMLSFLETNAKKYKQNFYFRYSRLIVI